MKLRFTTATMYVMSIIFGSQLLFSQAQFSLSDFDASDFPTIKAGFIALDAAGKSYNNLDINDFEIFENGLSMLPTATMDCDTHNYKPHVIIDLLVDQSTSMNDSAAEGQTRWDWVEDGVEAFLNALELTDSSAIGLHTFGGHCYLRQPFTQNKQLILDSLHEVEAYGVTRYDPAFLTPDYGPVDYLKYHSPYPVRKIIVFLTDGLPDFEPDADSIITACQSGNIQVYCIDFVHAYAQGFGKNFKGNGR